MVEKDDLLKFVRNHTTPQAEAQGLSKLIVSFIEAGFDHLSDIQIEKLQNLNKLYLTIKQFLDGKIKAEEIVPNLREYLLAQ